MSQRSVKPRLPKQRSNDWVELAGACVRVRTMLREHHKILNKFIGEKRPNDFWIYLPASDVERLYSEGMASMEILRKALKSR